MSTSSTRETCFIAMPITTHPDEAVRYGDPDHWSHVLKSLIVPAVEAAGFEAVLPVTTGSDLIHAAIIEQLSKADVVLCDLSSQNANVLFELGVRTSLNLPVALIRDQHTSLPFDIAGINTHLYRSTIAAYEIKEQIESLTKHLSESVRSCAGKNPLWQAFGMRITAEAPSAGDKADDARLTLILDQLDDLRSRFGSSGREEFNLHTRITASASRGETAGLLLARVLETSNAIVTVSNSGDTVVIRGDAGLSVLSGDVSELIESVASPEGYRLERWHVDNGQIEIILASILPTA